jgi:hypothetical protein
MVDPSKILGMAHFSGTGPQGTVCGGCSYFGAETSRGAGGHAVMPSICAKFVAMIRGKRGQREKPKVPATTPSCKYYQSKVRRR